MQTKTNSSSISPLTTAFAGLTLIITIISFTGFKTADASDIKVLIVGDTSFGENYFQAYGPKDFLKTRGYDYSLKNFIPLLKESDAVIANLETPLTDNLSSPLSGKQYLHWSTIDVAPMYLKKFNIMTVSLANNHSMDYGINGLNDTLNALRRNNIEWFGAGLSEFEAERPFIREFRIGKRSFKLAVIGVFEYRKHYDEKFGFYAKGTKGGTNPLDVEKIVKQIKGLKKNMPDIFIIVFPHWGGNYRWKLPHQTFIGREFIDAGADIVVGHGAHMMQEIERYNGSWIIYGLGNFVFNSPGRYQKVGVPPYSLIAQLLIQDKNDTYKKILRLYPIMTDNLKNGYQGRFLSGGEFDEAYNILSEKSSLPTIKKGRDIFGRYIEVSID